MAGEYEDLQTESEFARQQLVSAMTSLETARVKAEAKSRYVVAFQIPVLPDESCTAPSCLRPMSLSVLWYWWGFVP
ncbi:MAG: hypothetical protein ACLSHC_05385 [Bilophila wadsworthia]